MSSELLIKICADYMMLPIIIIGSYALIFKIPKGHRFEAYKRVLMAGLTAYLFAKLIGVVFQPSSERPFELLGVNAGASYLNNPGFPSDHTLFLAAIVGAVWFETRQKIITVILTVCLAIVCVGRVLALVHTPTDVIGGVVIALMGCVWYLNYKSRVALSSDK